MIDNCIICNNPKPSWKKKKTKTCSQECFSKYRFIINGNPEQRKKISESRKKYLKEHPESFFWTKSEKFNSVPCEHFKAFLKENQIDFVEEFYPLEDRFFRIDVSFPEHKLGIEINGSQHYEDGGKKLKKYYQERHDLIKSSGWNLIEIYHKNVWKEEILLEILEMIRKTLNSEKSFYKNFEKQIKKSKRQIELEEKSKLMIKGPKRRWNLNDKKIPLELNEKKLEFYREAIIQSSPGSWGWINRASKIANCSHTHIRRIVKNHLTEFDI